MKDVKFAGETRRLINNAMKGMTPRDKRILWNNCWQFIELLVNKQRMPLPLREKCNLVATHIYNLLRKNKQLGRREGDFHPEIYRVIKSIMSDILTDKNYGTGRD